MPRTGASARCRACRASAAASAWVALARGAERGEDRGIVPREVAGVGGAGQEVGLAQDRREQVAVGGHAVDLGLFERASQPPRRIGPGPAVRDHLGQHRVVVRADHRPVAEAGIHPDARRSDREAVQRAGGGHEPGRDVLGVHAHLDGVAVEPRLADFGRQRLAFGDPQLQLDQVQAGDRLGDRVLDLQPGVHLQEVERPVAVQHELDGTRAGIADRLARGDGRGGQRGPQTGVDARRRAFLHDLLVATLDRALALEQVDHGARRVAEDLHLDVPGFGHEPLEEHGAVAERGCRLAARAADRRLQVRGVGDQPHAASAAAECRLDQQRESHRVGQGGQIPGVLGRDGRAGQHGHAGVGHHGLGRYLGAHRRDRAGLRADEDQPGVGAGARERGVLRQEPVAGMDGVGAGGRGRRDDEVAAQVGVGGRRAGQPDRLVGQPHVGGFGVRVREDGDGGDAEPVRAPDDPGRDLAAVGDEELADGPGLGIVITSGRRRSRGGRPPGRNGRPTGPGPGRSGCRAGR